MVVRPLGALEPIEAELEEGELAFEFDKGEIEPEGLLPPEDPEPDDPWLLSLPPDPAPLEGLG